MQASELLAACPHLCCQAFKLHGTDCWLASQRWPMARLLLRRTLLLQLRTDRCQLRCQLLYTRRQLVGAGGAARRCTFQRRQLGSQPRLRRRRLSRRGTAAALLRLQRSTQLAQLCLLCIMAVCVAGCCCLQRRQLLAHAGQLSGGHGCWGSIGMPVCTCLQTRQRRLRPLQQRRQLGCLPRRRRLAAAGARGAAVLGPVWLHGNDPAQPAAQRRQLPLDLAPLLRTGRLQPALCRAQVCQPRAQRCQLAGLRRAAALYASHHRSDVLPAGGGGAQLFPQTTQLGSQPVGPRVFARRRQRAEGAGPRGGGRGGTPAGRDERVGCAGAVLTVGGGGDQMRVAWADPLAQHRITAGPNLQDSSGGSRRVMERACVKPWPVVWRRRRAGEAGGQARAWRFRAAPPLPPSTPRPTFVGLVNRGAAPAGAELRRRAGAQARRLCCVSFSKPCRRCCQSMIEETVRGCAGTPA